MRPPLLRADYTVYDVNVLVRQWLKDQGAKDSSVAEVLRDRKEEFQKKWKPFFEAKAKDKEGGGMFSKAKLLTVEFASHLVGPVGLVVTDGQPASPSAGYGEVFSGPWWKQCGSENEAQ